jgi:hypothetical protein
LKYCCLYTAGGGLTLLGRWSGRGPSSDFPPAGNTRVNDSLLFADSMPGDTSWQIRHARCRAVLHHGQHAPLHSSRKCSNSECVRRCVRYKTPPAACYRTMHHYTMHKSWQYREYHGHAKPRASCTHKCITTTPTAGDMWIYGAVLSSRDCKQRRASQQAENMSIHI